MRAFWIAVGVGITAYCFATHQPLWLSIGNVVLDVLLILEFLKARRT
jgi:hypothetical protein